MYLSAKGDIRFDTFDNIVLAKCGRKSKLTYSIYLAAAAFHIVFFTNFNKMKKHRLRLV